MHEFANLHDLALRFPVGTKVHDSAHGHATVVAASKLRPAGGVDAFTTTDAHAREARFEDGGAFFAAGMGTGDHALRLAVANDYVGREPRSVRPEAVTIREQPEPRHALALIEAYGGKYLARGVTITHGGRGARVTAQQFTLVESGGNPVEFKWQDTGDFGPPTSAKVLPLPTSVPGTTLLSGSEREDARCQGYAQGKREGYKRGKDAGQRIGRQEAIATIGRLVEKEAAR